MKLNTPEEILNFLIANKGNCTSNLTCGGGGIYSINTCNCPLRIIWPDGAVSGCLQSRGNDGEDDAWILKLAEEKMEEFKKLKWLEKLT